MDEAFLWISLRHQESFRLPCFVEGNSFSTNQK